MNRLWRSMRMVHYIFERSLRMNPGPADEEQSDKDISFHDLDLVDR